MWPQFSRSSITCWNGGQVKKFILTMQIAWSGWAIFPRLDIFLAKRANLRIMKAILSKNTKSSSIFMEA
jgi:hypothetical protein